MKTKLKLKSIMLFVMAALLAFAIVACEEAEEEENGDPKFLEGNVSISGDLYITAVLTANYTGNESNTMFRWYRNGAHLADEVQDVLEPTEAGTYYVTVTAPGYDNTVTSTSVDVTVPAWSGFFGTWVANNSAGDLEYVTISHNRIKLEDTDSTKSDFGHWIFTISGGWETATALWSGGNPNNAGFSTNSGRRLTGTMLEATGGYAEGDTDFRQATLVDIWLSSNGNNLVRTSPRITAPSSNTAAGRIYSRPTN